MVVDVDKQSRVVTDYPSPFYGLLQQQQQQQPWDGDDQMSDVVTRTIHQPALCFMPCELQLRSLITASINLSRILIQHSRHTRQNNSVDATFLYTVSAEFEQLSFRTWAWAQVAGCVEESVSWLMARIFKLLFLAKYLSAPENPSHSQTSPRPLDWFHWFYMTICRSYSSKKTETRSKSSFIPRSLFCFLWFFSFTVFYITV